MFVKIRRVKLAATKSDFKLSGQSVCLMTENGFYKKNKQELFDLWSERDDIELVERYKLEFELVESRRIEGQPRHQNNFYLASIRESDLQSPPTRRLFWQTVQSKLKHRNLTKNDIDKITAKIEERVVFV